MRIRVLSDLHIEFFGFEPAEVPADVVVLAGDILTEHYGLVRPPVDLWIHGHTHCSCDYGPVKGTRVLCNPRGYGPSDLNDRFDQRLVVTL